MVGQGRHAPTGYRRPLSTLHLDRWGILRDATRGKNWCPCPLLHALFSALVYNSLANGGRIDPVAQGKNGHA